MTYPSPLAGGNAGVDAATLVEGRRCRLTLVFTDLTGSKQLGRAMELEDYASLLSTLRVIWREAADRHGGRVIRCQGDGALIVFGLAGSSEEDGRRAVEAALDIHEQTRRLRPRNSRGEQLHLRAHSGVHAGTVLLAQGDLARGEFDLSGDVPNTTAQLSQLAGADQILASLDALGPDSQFFELGQEPQWSSLRSSLPAAPQQRLEIRAVLGRRAAARRFEARARRGLTPFVGRKAQIAKLRRFVAGPADRHRCLVVIGEPGLGKTRLLEEFIARRKDRSTLVLRGGCERYGSAELLQPFAQMLRSTFGGSDTAPPTATGLPARSTEWPVELALHWSRLSTRLAGPSGSDDESATELLADLLQLFAGLADQRSLLMLVDDWQWADDASRRLLDALLQRCAGIRIVIASRPDDDGLTHPAGADIVRLQPFEEAETAVAMRRWLPAADPFLVARVHGYTGGVPLYIEEVCHSVGADRLWQSLQHQHQAQAWLGNLIAARFGRLSAQQAQIVRTAAVIGNLVPCWLLADICEVRPDDAMLASLADADFLYPSIEPGVLRFKHGITRDAIYETIGLQERVALHRRIVEARRPPAATPDSEEGLETLAHHSACAGDWARAADYAERAADRAVSAFALDRAREQYVAVLRALDRGGEMDPPRRQRWCTVAGKLGMVGIFDPLALHDGLAVFERAVSLAVEIGEAGPVARARYWLGYMQYGFGRFRDAAAELGGALEIARRAEQARLVAQIEATLGQVRVATCDYDAALGLIDAALDSKRQHSRPGSGFAVGSAYTLACKGSVLADRGDFRGAHACFDEALGLITHSMHPVANSVRNWVCLACIWQGRWADAERIAAESIGIAENSRTLLLLATSRAMAGFARWMGRGETDGIEQLRDAVHWIESRGGHFYTSLHRGWLVQACVVLGRIAEARQHAAQVRRRSRQGERLGEALACRALAVAEARRGRFGVAGRWLAAARSSARTRQSAREEALNDLTAARILALQGSAAQAGSATDAAAARLRALGMPWHAQARTIAL